MHRPRPRTAAVRLSTPRFVFVPSPAAFRLIVPLLAFAPSPAVAAYFVDATENLGSPQPCEDTKEGCYSHYAALADLDGDGGLDLLFANGGGYYEPGVVAPIALYLNDGDGQFDEQGATLLDGFEGRVRQVALGDVDRDGDLDLYLADSYGLQPDALFINQGGSPLSFVDEGAARLPLSSRSAGSRFGDLDGDGDLDLLLTDWGDDPPSSAGTARVYLNDGHGFFTEKAGAVPQDTAAVGTGPIDVDLFDADGDFDLDLLIASRQGDSLLFINDGRGSFSDGDSRLPGQPGPYVYGPDVCDIDGDGDLDLWMDNGSLNRKEQLLVNTGRGTFIDETRLRIPGTNNPGADDNEVQCADIDGDGDFDAVIASLSGNERVLLNSGGRFTLASNGFPRVTDSSLGMDLGDVNGDRLLDAVTAQGENGSFLNRLYLGTSPSAADSRPPTFRALERLPAGASGRVAVRFAVSDNTTSDIGPRLREVSVQVTGGSSHPAVFIGGDLFRAEIDLPAGATVRYRACATDAAGNSGCSAEATVSRRGSSRR